MSFEYFDVKSGLPFQPVQCSEETIKAMVPEDGHIYFTTDTKKIFLGKNREAIQMCGATGFFYGTKYIPEDNSGNKPDPNVTFYFTEIEGKDIPQVDDLILNEDGCFYRVKSVDKSVEEIKTLRLTLQGTGNGSTSGGPVTYSISPVNGFSRVFSTTADKIEIGFIANYNGDDASNYIASVECYFANEDVPFHSEYTAHRAFNVNQIIDLTPYRDKFSISKKAITLKVLDKYGEERSSDKYSIQLVDLSLTEAADFLFSAKSDSIEFKCNLNGGVGILKNRKITYTIYKDNNGLLGNKIDTIDYATADNGIIPKTLDLSKCSHGVYHLIVQASGNIDGGGLVVSNELRHKFIYFQSGRDALFDVLIPTVTEQFTNIDLQYLLVEENGGNKVYTLEVYLNNVLYDTLNISPDTTDSYRLMFEDIGKYTLKMTVVELAKTFTAELDITAYTGELPIINTNRDDLKLYLNPRKKNNNALDRNIWKSETSNYTGELSNFYFNEINGWSIDEEEASYLKLAQGAKFSVPNYYPLANDAMASSQDGITIELDFKLKQVLDYNKDLISCLSKDRDGKIYAGFAIRGNKAIFYSSTNNEIIGSEVPNEVNLVENQRIKISWVIEKRSNNFPMILTYFNGKISHVINYTDTEKFVDFGGDGAKKAVFTVDSTFGEIDLYGVRFYSTGLSQNVVLNNYQASLGTLEEREASYKSNKILNSDNKIDLRLIEDIDYLGDIPYIKLTGGCAAADNEVMTMGTKDEFALPIGKKDYRLIDFELVYPKHENSYFKLNGYQDFFEKCTFESGKDATNQNPAFGEIPLTGAVMYAQGTSSLEYPVKNLRIAFKTKKINVRPGMEAVNLICLKADFMESSGSHNTGAANYIDKAYSMMGMKTPGQEAFPNEDIVTCIKGHPVAVFWSPSGKDGTYEFIGKYNLNLDKATPEPFGFKNIPEKYNADAPVKFGWDENGKNTIRCFEYLDNSIKVCNFLAKEGKTYEETWYELITDDTGKTHYGWTEGFESRHPDKMKGEHDADDIYDMASWVHELHNLRQTDNDKAIARFREEYQCYFNKDYLIAYYLITNVLLMIDSRTKNCMMASWGPQSKTYYDVKQNDKGEWVRDEDSSHETNYHVWYPIFYDMDTMLGIDNQGYPRLNYYDEDTNEKTFNGNDVLWNFVRDALSGEIATMYGQFESAAGMFTAGVILPYFNDNQANLANEAFYNNDANYKYIDTFRKGYTNHLTGDIVKPGTGERLYAAQGDRSLDREYFITNRIKFLRAKYQSTNYSDNDRIEFRIYIPTEQSGSTPEEKAKIFNSIKVVPSDTAFKFTALGPGYAGLKIGQNGQIINHLFTAGQLEATLKGDQSPDDTESYMLGLSNLADIGDLSGKYLGSFSAKNPNKLRKLILGSDYKDYYNPFLVQKNGKIVVSACELLEEFNLFNCPYYQDIDFSNCKQLKRVYMTGSNANTVRMPVGTVIEELRLPNTFDTLVLEDQIYLSNDNFTYGYFDYGNNIKIYDGDGNIIPGGKYVNDYSTCLHVSIGNTPIDTYEIAKTAPLQSYRFKDLRWNITENDTQYVSTSDTVFDPEKTYYEYIGNNEYKVYEGTDFSDSITLYEKFDLINEDGKITNIPVLEKLIKIRPYENIAKDISLIGTIKINVSATVNQFDLYYKYNPIFPNLKFEYGDKISGTSAYNIEFFRVDSDNMTDDVKSDYTVMTDGSMTLAQLTSAEGPAGSALFTPVKAPTNTEIFDFTGIWVDYETGEEISVDQFATYKPTRNMKLAPKFNERIRYYTIEFYDHNNELVMTLGEDLKIEYNTILGRAFPSMTGLWYRYRVSDADFGENERWTFKGWQTQASFNNPTTQFSLYNLNELNVVENMKMWEYWEKEDASTTPTDSYCFDFVTETHTILGESVTGLAANLKASWFPFMGGKITIPATYEGQDIKFVGGFRDAVQITDIYFLNNAKVIEFSEYAFGNSEQTYDSQLHTVHNIPSTLISVGNRAFQNCLSLVNCNLPNTVRSIGTHAFQAASNVLEMQVIMNELPTSLEYLGEYAFRRSGPNIKFSVIPNKLKALPDWCLGGCPEITINHFGGPESSLTTIGSNVFYNSGSSSVTTLTFEAPVTTMNAESLFKSSGHENYEKSITTINTHSLFGYDNSDDWEIALFGWRNPNGTLDTKHLRVDEITTNLTA